MSSLINSDIQCERLDVRGGRGAAASMNAARADGEKRIAAGLDKLFGTSEAERVTLFEASLIRYFQPAFNKEFKDSFPSTNLKILLDCYDKDCSAIVSEICIDELPFKLSFTGIAPAQYHRVKFDHP